MANVRVVNPYSSETDCSWLKGNLHTHTTRSDGLLSPQETVDRYAGLGYDFLGLSDHDTAPDLSGLNARGMILVPVCEVSGASGHVLALGAERSVPAWQGQQATIAAIRAAGAQAILCHPDWGDGFNHYSAAQLIGLTDYEGTEIYNGSVEDESGLACATAKWDQALSEERWSWGFASDDTHKPTEFGRGWCVVQTKERTLSALLSAFRRGSFYASSGATIAGIEQEGTRIRVRSPEAEAVAAIGLYGRRLAWAEGTELVFDVANCASPYVRFECFGRGGRKAWSQPFRLAGETMDRMRRRLTETPELSVWRADRAPVLSGRMDDPVWARAQAATTFVGHADASPAPVRTELRALATESELHFGIRCEEPNADRLKVSVQRHQASNLWMDDGIELFLDADHGRERYWHIMINAAGFAWIGEQGRIEEGTRPLPALRTKATRSRSDYVLEAALAWPDGKLPLSPDGLWGFNCVRNRHAGGEPASYAWSFTRGSNHAPRRFGILKPSARG